jgi:hypothetical protein
LRCDADHPRRSGKTALAVSVLCALSLSSCMLAPGGGGSIQSSPESVKAGEPAVLRLELSVWGSGKDISGRYADVAVFYRLVGAAQYEGPLKAQPVPHDAKHESYEFTIPGYPTGTTGEIEFYFALKLDGQPSRIEGLKKIRIL